MGSFRVLTSIRLLTMTENASPNRKPRPTKYPAAIPRTMTTDAQRAAIDDLVEQNGGGVAEVVRMLVSEGLASVGYVEPS